MTSDLFNRQLASYTSVHRDRRNKATHHRHSDHRLFAGAHSVASAAWRQRGVRRTVRGDPGGVGLDGAGSRHRHGHGRADAGGLVRSRSLGRRLGTGRDPGRLPGAVRRTGRCNFSAITTRASGRRCSTISSKASSGRCSWWPKASWSWASAATLRMPWAKVTSRRGEQG
jgi:hypothetical protein